MGYSHYWTVKEEINQKLWDSFTKDTRKVLKMIKKTIPLRFEYGSEKAPLVNKNIVRFNGALEDGAETFIIRRLPHNDFCKTNEKPYDLAVCVCLLLAKYHFQGNILIKSDGNDEWNDAIEFVKNNFGYTLPTIFPSKL